MTKECAIQKVVAYLLRNVESVISTGLYNGKAGLSLALFTAADYLQDEQLENRAYRLLQESLIVKNSDLSFENGLAGIGYSLLYLIENKYLEADFDEIFGIQYETFIKVFETIEKDPLMLVNSLRVIYFLSKVSHIKNDVTKINEIIKKISEGLELFLVVQFQDFYDIHYINSKTDVLNIYQTYLKLIDYSGYTHFSQVLLEDYAALYRKGRIISSLETGFYLRKIAEKYNIKGYDDIINENINNGIINIHAYTFSLKERIDLAKIIGDIGYNDVKKQDILPNIENLQKEKEIRNLVRTIDEKSFPFGYEAGLGRLLIYSVNNHIELL